MQIDCPFSYAVCKEQMLRKDVPEHIKEEFHFTLLEAATQGLTKGNQELKAKKLNIAKPCNRHYRKSEIKITQRAGGGKSYVSKCARTCHEEFTNHRE